LLRAIFISPAKQAKAVQQNTLHLLGEALSLLASAMNYMTKITCLEPEQWEKPQNEARKNCRKRWKN